MRVVNLLGARLQALTEAECIAFILNELTEGRGGWLVTMNLNHLRAFTLLPEIRQAYEQATLILPDGMPLIWASRLQGNPLPGRVTGSNLVWSLTAAAANQRRSIFFLGGSPGVALMTAEILAKENPGLQIAGVCAPPLGFESQPESVQAIVEAVRTASPDIVYVALGTPKEDRFIQGLRAQLPHAFFIGVGASFDFVAGKLPRAPQWLQNAGLEWLHRLGHEPRRLVRRYLVEGLPFMLRLMLSAVRQRFSGNPNDQPSA